MTDELQEDQDFYWEGDRMVFTARFLRERGYCCRSLCRHCPYMTEEEKRQLREELG